jgi:hypothetical protein
MAARADPSPVLKGWPTLNIDETNAARYFNGQGNIGVLLGQESNGPYDVDLDCHEARAIAPYLLPPTKARFGRKSSRNSHYLYESNIVTDKAALRYEDPDAKSGEKETTVELRGTNAGAQTVFPGSTHKGTGETIEWEEFGKPAKVEGAELQRCVKEVAAAVMIARRWGAVSTRHDVALALGSFLARCSMPLPRIKLFVEAVATVIGWDLKEARRCAENGAEYFATGAKDSPGLPRIKELLGLTDKSADKLAEWLGYRAPAFFAATTATTPPNDSLLENGVSLGDFQAYMPKHNYMFMPTQELWPAGSVNASLGPIALVGPDGTPLKDEKGKPKTIPANVWLDQNQHVEQMTWAPAANQP